MRSVDPITQVESIKNKQLVIFSAMAHFYGSLYNDFMGYKPPRKYINNKPPWYKLDLPKRFKDVPYESRQEVRRLIYTLKEMDSMTDFKKVMLYKFR